MSLRPFVQFAHIFRHGQSIGPIIQHLGSFTRSYDSIRAYHPARKHTNRASCTPSLLSDRLRPAHTIQTHGKISSISQCRHESSSSDPELCAHCRGKINPKHRRLVDSNDRTKGWHCRACIRTVKAQGALPNEQQLASMRRRRLWKESGELHKSSPCRKCGIETAPTSRRQFVDPDNPYAGFHCRACVQHAILQAKLQIQNAQYGIWHGGLGSGIPIAPKREYPCDHCGEPVTPEKKRRYVDSGNSSAGYYCRSCARRLCLEDKLPTEAQLKAIKVLRGKLAKFVTARKQKNPCQHCGDITLPGSRRTLVKSGDFSSGYYCRPCAQHQRMKDELPSEMAIRDRRLRKHLKLKRLGLLEYQQKLESETEQAEQAKSTETPEEKDQG